MLRFNPGELWAGLEGARLWPAAGTVLSDMGLRLERVLWEFVADTEVDDRCGRWRLRDDLTGAIGLGSSPRAWSDHWLPMGTVPSDVAGTARGICCVRDGVAIVTGSGTRGTGPDRSCLLDPVPFLPPPPLP